MLIDSHCHLDFSCFDSDRAEVLQRCHQQQINTIVIPGTQACTWQKQIDLCHSYPQLRFALGLHPYFLNDYNAEHLTQLDSLLSLQKHKVVALGEIGLDHNIDVDWTLQVNIFTKQLQMAKEHNLPVILHHRNSHNDLIRILKAEKFNQGGIIHAFSGSLQEALTYIALGFKIGVGGGITYERANKTRNTIKQLPLESLVLETDSPDMPLMGKQGQRNSPEYLTEILDVLTKLRSESTHNIGINCTTNVRASLANLKSDFVA